MSTDELSAATGVPTSTLRFWIRHGTLRPAVLGVGRGDGHRFNEHSVAQVKAILAVQEALGNGHVAQLVIEQGVPQIRKDTPFILVPEFAIHIA